MSTSQNRYRSGRVSEVRAKIQAGNQIAVGDLVTLIGGYVKNFTLAAETTAGFHSTFLGVLVQGGTTGLESQDTDCLVYDSGEFEYPLSVPAAAPHQVGDLVGASGDQVVDFLVAGVYGETIGRLARPCLTGDTTVLVRILSTAMSPVALAPA